ncbi:MAG TPA: hypothetical protein H9902_08430 [Candidatus Stackebrandtia faecavium]|nr:hypothetical protein [Candidatus Stackebrandtia faecavium]
MIETKQPVVTEPDEIRAERWVKRHGLDSGCISPLLLDRLALRRVSHERELLTLVLCAIPLMAWSVIASITDVSIRLGANDTNVRGLIDIAVFYIVLATIAWWSSRRFLRVEYEYAQQLPRRAASSTPRGVTTVLGKWYVLALVIMYPGGTAVGLALSLISTDVETRALATIMAIGTIAIGIINAVVNYTTLRRPAIADNSNNLVIDDGLRTEEAHRVPPYAAALALIVAVNATTPAAMIAFLTYGITAAVLWHVGVARGQYRQLTTARRTDEQ